MRQGYLKFSTAFHLSANILGCQAPPLEIKSPENPRPDSQRKGQTLLIFQSPFTLFTMHHGFSWDTIMIHSTNTWGKMFFRSILIQIIDRFVLVDRLLFSMPWRNFQVSTPSTWPTWIGLSAPKSPTGLKAIR